jgi:hypothetical protein
VNTVEARRPRRSSMLALKANKEPSLALATHAHFLSIKPVGRDGRFSLVRLDARMDYEVYAEQDDLVSEKVIISGSQEDAEVILALKLSKEQENH